MEEVQILIRAEKRTERIPVTNAELKAFATRQVENNEHKMNNVYYRFCEYIEISYLQIEELDRPQI